MADPALFVDCPTCGQMAGHLCIDMTDPHARNRRRRMRQFARSQDDFHASRITLAERTGIPERPEGPPTKG